MGQYPVIDLHEDIAAYFILHGAGNPLGDFGKDVEGREADIPKYVKGNVKLVFAALFPGIETFEPEESRKFYEVYGVWIPGVLVRSAFSLVWEQLRVYYRLSEVYDEFKLVLTYDDAERVLRDPKSIGLLIHLEGADVIDDPYDLTLWHKLGLRSLGITWNHSNKYGTGCSERRDLGLSSLGEELVRQANRLGIIVDLAHASKKTVLDVLEVSKKPIMISHTNIRKFVDTPRNIDDEILEAVYENKGVVGISCIGPLIKPKGRPSIDDLVEHFMYVYERYGAEILAIGTDFLGLLGLPSPKGLGNIGLIQDLLKKLADKGLSDNNIKKIAYENALRILRSNLT